jgi:hypothetical protein
VQVDERLASLCLRQLLLASLPLAFWRSSLDQQLKSRRHCHLNVILYWIGIIKRQGRGYVFRDTWHSPARLASCSELISPSQTNNDKYGRNFDTLQKFRLLVARCDLDLSSFCNIY